MSTGLTYVTITDFAVGSNPDVSGTFIFSSYDEAYAFGDWYLRSIQQITSGAPSATVNIFTTGPSSSGYFEGYNVPPTFVSFD